jgi:hypothetical protein
MLGKFCVIWLWKGGRASASLQMNPYYVPVLEEIGRLTMTAYL